MSATTKTTVTCWVHKRWRGVESGQEPREKERAGGRERDRDRERERETRELQEHDVRKVDVG